MPVLGNNLAGVKVIASPCLSSLLCEPDSTSEVLQDILGLFPACTVTHTMARRAAGQSLLLSNDQATSLNNNLYDTILI